GENSILPEARWAAKPKQSGDSFALLPSCMLLEFDSEDGVVQPAEEGVAEIFGQRGQGGHRFHGRRQALDYDLPQAELLHIERDQRMRDRARVRGVEIEMAGEDGEAFRIRSLERQQSIAREFR